MPSSDGSHPRTKTVYCSSTVSVHILRKMRPHETHSAPITGMKAWMVMESASFITFIFAFLNSPLSFKNYGHAPEMSLSNPSAILSCLFLIHYVNRAFISPLRSPSRSKFHISVPLAGLSFTVVNGTLMGAYLSSTDAAKFLDGALSRPLFWLGVGLWAFGFAGNLLHDEILYNIRRNANSGAAAKEQTKGADDSDEDDDHNNGKEKPKHYAIPHGYLYSLVSYPNYFCEWLEWLGFALAAAPIPSLMSIHSYQPPWIFFLNEVLVMFPRAYRGHKWYHERFPDYPKERKAVIPFVF